VIFLTEYLSCAPNGLFYRQMGHKSADLCPKPVYFFRLGHFYISRRNIHKSSKIKPPQWVFAAAGGKVHSGYSGDRKTLL